MLERGGKHGKCIRNLETIMEELSLLCGAAEKQKVECTREEYCCINENL